MYRLGPKLRNVTSQEVNTLLGTCGYRARTYQTQSDRTDYVGPGNHSGVSAWVRGGRAKYYLHNADTFPLNLKDYEYDRHNQYCTKEELNAIFTDLKKAAETAQIAPHHIATALQLYAARDTMRDIYRFEDILHLIANTNLDSPLLNRMLDKGYSVQEIHTYATMNPGLINDLLG